MELSNINDEVKNEDDDQLDYWNNWLPSSNHSKGESCSIGENQALKKPTKNVVFNTSKPVSIISYPENSKYGNWIPPVSFLNADFNKVEKILPESKQKQSQKETKVLVQSNEVNKEKFEVSEVSFKCSKNITWKKEINLDWGKRRELHDATKFNDSDKIWGIVNLGMFASIKIWVNEYGNICGSAEGQISKLYSSETTVICITNLQLIRKMLGLSGAQWSSICECLQEAKTTLKFDAFQNFDVTKKTNLEKLWIFICKRRHFLPDQCMLVKLNGAVKCMRKFQIIPKLLVQDIRNIQGEPIL